MKTLRQQFHDRLLDKYNALIEELEQQNQQNSERVPEANLQPDDPEIREWAELARDNLTRLTQARGEREYLLSRMQ